MALALVNLDGDTRKLMLDEIDADRAARNLYISSRLSSVGQQDYPSLLKDAAMTFDDSWLAAELRKNARINATEERRKPKGGFTTVRVPDTAADTSAEGEFNRFFLRGLCLRALAEGIERWSSIGRRPYPIRDRIPRRRSGPPLAPPRCSLTFAETSESIRPLGCHLARIPG
jgi:hypothetical protein